MPRKIGELVSENCGDSRVTVIRNEKNLGVGGAAKVGFQTASMRGAELLVKVDGDGQINPELIPKLIQPLIDGGADYAKGNRFFNIEAIQQMPKIRIIGNIGLSFFTKLSSGYWDIFDPNNGFIAIRSDILKQLPLNKISDRYFFESDMLFRLNLIRAVVVDVPMHSIYGDEESSLNILSSFFEFSFKNARNFTKRIVLNYFLREFNLASLQLTLGCILASTGLIIGSLNWWESANTRVPTQNGTLVLTAMTFLSGLQFLLSFFAYDISNTPGRRQ